MRTALFPKTLINTPSLFEQGVDFGLRYWGDVRLIALYLKFSAQLSIRGNVFRKLSGSRQGKSRIHTFECIFSKFP